MAQLTREQMIDIFGGEPQTPPPVVEPPKPDPYVTNFQRAVSPGASLWEQVKAAIDIAAQMPGAVARTTRGDGNFVQNISAAPNITKGMPVTRMSENVNAGVAGIPGALPGMVDLVRKGVPAVAEGIMSDDDKAVTSRIADAFMDNVLPKESINALADIQAQALDQFVANNPGATKQDIAEFHKQYLDSDEFYNATLQQLPTGLRWATQTQQWANKVSGLGLRPDETSATDEALQIFGSALVGLPEASVAKLGRPIAAALGQRAARSIPTRIAARTLEAATPLTLPLSPGNIALNTGVGVGVNEAIRGLTGQDTMIPYEKMYNPDNNPDPATIGVAGGIGAGILFGLPGVSRQIMDQVGKEISEGVEAVAKGTKYVPPEAGQTLEEQSTKLTPQISRARGLADENAPVKAAAQKFKPADDKDTVPLLDAAMSSASTANRVEYTNNALNYGILEGIDNTVPFTEIERAFLGLDDVGKTQLDNYVYALQRQSNEAAYEKSLIQQISEAQSDIVAARASANGRQLSAATKKFTELQGQYRQLQADDPSTRSMMRDWTRDQTQQFISQAEQNPNVNAVGDAMRKVSGDLLKYMEKNGLIDADTAAKWRGKRDLHVKVQERPYPNKSGLARRALLFKDKFKTADNSDVPFFFNTASRNITGEGAVVNNPLPAVAALKESIIDTVRNVAANNTRREVIDRLDSLPNARGNLLEPYAFPIGQGRTTTSIGQAQYNRLFPRGIPDEDKYIKIFRNGKIELWRFGDENITRSLQFAPTAFIPVLNATRKINQALTTGLGAPWFAARAFFWDVPVAQTTKNAGRSLGLIDTFARRLFMNTALERPVGTFMNNAFDPTAFVSSALAIPEQLGLRAARAVGEKIANDLATHSGVFNAIASTGPRGQQFVQQVGTVMADAFDRSALAIMSRNMTTSISHLNDVSKIQADYASASKGVTGALRQTFDAYKAMLESVHMATRYAFFARNYGNLKSKYGPDIPANELKKLVQETRNLTGDMSRRSNSKGIQKLTSTIPYSNAMIQGTRHILHSAIPNSLADATNKVGGNIIRDQDTRFWTQFLSGVALPSFGALAMLSNWEGAEDYWYNKTPKWQQMTGIPIPDPSVLKEAYETGKMPEFSPDKLNIVPIAPELAMMLYPVTEAARFMGMIGSPQYSTPQPFGVKLKDVMDQVTSFATPPVVSAALATSGKRFDLHGLLTGQGGVSDIQNSGSGANADMMTTDGSIPQAVYDTLGALLGSASQLAMQSLNVFDIAEKEGQSFTEAASQAFDTGSFEAKRRLPQVDTGLWNARDRAYAFTPESEYVYKTEKSLEPIIGPDRQLSIERDAKNRVALSEELGLNAPNRIRDPSLRAVSTAVWDAMKKKGPYKQASDEYSQVRKLLKDLENSRQRMDDDKYNKLRNELIHKQQQYVQTKSRVLQSLERQLEQQVGRQFQAQYGVPFTFDNLSKAVRKDVGQE